MLLGSYGAALATARLSTVFNISRLVKVINRGMKSTTEGNCLNSSDNLEDKEQEQPQLWNYTSKVAHEEEFPSLSASISSMPKSKRRTRIDLGTCCEQESEEEAQNIGPLHVETLTSISHQNDQYLPTSFGKKRLPSSSRRAHQNYHEHGDAKRSSKFSPGDTMDEPFDICLSETRESNSGEEWVPEVQSTLENAEYEDNLVDSVEEVGQVLRPGMVLFKNYISLSAQVGIVNTCRELGRGPGGFYRPGYDDGAKLRLYMMCLGLDWNPQTRAYAERRHHDNVAPPQIPHEFITLVSRVLDDSHTLIERDFKTVNPEAILPAMSPDVCIVNFYTSNGRLGLHQDRDESKESLLKGLPVVSISVGDSAEFLYGDQRGVSKAQRVLLESGDVLIFGGESRHIFHGVKNITPNTAPPALLESTKLRSGRLNLTFRKF